MKNDFLNELKSIAMESVGVEVTVDPYAGSECAEELLTLDVLEANAIAMESYEEAMFAEVFEAQELALESAELGMSDIAKFNGELGMEAIGNAVKRGAYGVEIQAKKLLQKIVKLVMSIIDYFTVADGKFKSYNKLLKKYKERLNKVNPSENTNPDKEEKEYTIRDWSNLHDQFTKFSDEANVEGLKAVMTAATSGALSDLEGKIKALSSLLGSESNIDSAMEDFKSKLKDQLSEIKDESKERETISGTFYSLRDKLGSIVDKAIADTNKDIKYKGELKKIKAKVGKLNRDLKDTENSETIRKINKIAMPVLTAVQKKATLRYKILASGYQGLLADMAKLISGGTRVND